MSTKGFKVRVPGTTAAQWFGHEVRNGFRELSSLQAFALGLILTGTQVFAADLRECQFDLVLDGTGKTYVADWQVEIRSNNGAARVDVIGSGAYDGTERRQSSGAAEVVFRSAVSTETMTIGADGETLWEINFDDGGVMAYFGTCGQTRKAN